MAETKAPTPVVKTSINVNGTALSFVQGTINRGDNKGIPVYLPAFKNDAKTPDFAELATLVAALGSTPLLTAFSKIIRTASVDASVASAFKGADGKYVADIGKFVSALLSEVADLVAAQKDELKEALAETEGKINELFGKIMADYAANRPLDVGLKNQSMQLQLKRTELINKIQKKGRKDKKDESATPAPAAAPAK